MYVCLPFLGEAGLPGEEENYYAMSLNHLDKKQMNPQKSIVSEA